MSAGDPATSLAEVNPDSAVTIALAGHIDEIGVIATYIDEGGLVYIAPIGGWDPQVLVGQRIRFAGHAGDVVGVVGKKPIHLMKPDEREKASKITELWVDVGAANREEAVAMIGVGDAGVIDSHTIDLPNHRIASRSIDNRIGAFVVLEALRRYAASPGPARLVAVATAQEEIGLHGGGALVAASRLPSVTDIAVDVTAQARPWSGKEVEERNCSAAVITAWIGELAVVVRLLRDAAERRGIRTPFPLAGDRNLALTIRWRAGVATAAGLGSQSPCCIHPTDAGVAGGCGPGRRAARRGLPRSHRRHRLHRTLGVGAPPRLPGGWASRCWSMLVGAGQVLVGAGRVLVECWPGRVPA